MITANTIVPSQLCAKIEQVQKKVSELEAKITALSQEKFELLSQNQALVAELEIQKDLLAQYQEKFGSLEAVIGTGGSKIAEASVISQLVNGKFKGRPIFIEGEDKIFVGGFSGAQLGMGLSVIGGVLGGPPGAFAGTVIGVSIGAIVGGVLGLKAHHFEVWCREINGENNTVLNEQLTSTGPLAPVPKETAAPTEIVISAT